MPLSIFSTLPGIGSGTKVGAHQIFIVSFLFLNGAIRNLKVVYLAHIIGLLVKEKHGKESA